MSHPDDDSRTEPPGSEPPADREKQHEEEPSSVGKAGYKQESKPRSETKIEKVYTGEGGRETETPEPENSEPERKVVVFQHSWGEKKGYLGPERSAEGKAKYAKGKYEGGFLHYKAEAESELSYDLEKHEGNLTVVSAKVDASAIHAEASGELGVGAMISDLVDWLFGGSEPVPTPTSPAPGVALMAARVGDLTTHGSPLVPGIGSPNVLIGGMPAWRALVDFHACPIVKGTVPDVGGVVLVGSPTVFINSMNACRVTDTVVETPGGPNAIATGCPTVFIGGTATAAAEGGLALAGKAEGDVGTAGAEASLSAVMNQDKVLAEGKIGGMAAVAKGAIEGSLTIPLWGSHAMTLGSRLEGSVISAGAGAHAGAGWTKEKGFQASAGAKAAAGLGAGLNFSIGVR